MQRTGVLLSVAKAIRSFIFTSLAVATPFYISYLGYNALVTSILILVSLGLSTLFLYIYTALHMQIRKKLILLSSLFSVSLLILFLGNNVYFLILALIVGALSLAGRDLTVNQSLEQYTISLSVKSQHEKNMAFSMYNFASYTSGAVASSFLFLYKSEDFRVILLVNLIMSLVQVAIYLSLRFPELKPTAQKIAIKDPETRSHIRNLSALFSIDSLGGGLVNTAIISLWFKEVYGITLSQAGLIFLIVNIVTALSVIASGYISKGMGLVRTMVYTHLISNVMLFMVPVFHSLLLSEVFLFLRQSTSQMDVPARDSLVNTIIPADARVNSNSVFLAVRNGFQIPGPGLAGLLLDVFPEGVFFSASLIKISYDLAFFARYHKYRV